MSLVKAGSHVINTEYIVWVNLNHNPYDPVTQTAGTFDQSDLSVAILLNLNSKSKSDEEGSSPEDNSICLVFEGEDAEALRTYFNNRDNAEVIVLN